jgi:nucleotide-binding universal stress UspA family protein
MPLDGSETGEAALLAVEDLVSKLAPGARIEVTLLQLVSIQPYIVAAEAGLQVPDTDREMESSKQKALEYLDRTAEILRSEGAAVRIRVEIGSPAEEIITVADEIDANLIAMSTHGRSGITRWAFGSVSDRVLRGAHQPVLLVRARKSQQSQTTAHPA